MPFCDEITGIALEIGSVNTVYKKDGRLIGTNTDYEGFLYALKRSGVTLKNKKVLILGAGGTSLTVQKCARDCGAKKISIAKRNHDFSDDRDAEIIINATPIGTFPENGGKIIDLADFPDCSGVVDVVYNPLYTDLLLRAKERGIVFSNGLPMLVAQAAAAASLFTGKNYASMNEQILGRVVSAIQNIVLIGMPGAGKSSIGQKLALALGRDFVDIDDVVSFEAGLSIPEIFEKYGEKRFRDMESAAAAEYGKSHGLVIATGGGIILRRENMDALRQNAIVLFLDKPQAALATDGRPLSRDIKTLKEMYKERLPLYEKYSDYLIKL
jgi:shikimate dehydrogenase